MIDNLRPESPFIICGTKTASPFSDVEQALPDNGFERDEAPDQGEDAVYYSKTSEEGASMRIRLDLADGLVIEATGYYGEVAVAAVNA